VWSVLQYRNSVSKEGKKMSNKDSSLSAVQTEAIVHFSLIVRLLGFEDGRFGPLSVSRSLAFEDTQRIELRTSFYGNPIEGKVVLRNEDGQWRLYCAASNIKFMDLDVSFSYDKEARTYHITKFFRNGGSESITVNVVTGQRKTFADPEDAPA
jgi:hypothetical protein